MSTKWLNPSIFTHLPVPNVPTKGNRIRRTISVTCHVLYDVGNASKPSFIIFSHLVSFIFVSLVFSINSFMRLRHLTISRPQFHLYHVSRHEFLIFHHLTLIYLVSCLWTLSADISC